MIGKATDGLRDAFARMMPIASFESQQQWEGSRRIANERRRREKNEADLKQRRRERGYVPQIPATLVYGDRLYIRIGPGHYRLDRRPYSNERADVDIDTEETTF